MSGRKFPVYLFEEEALAELSLFADRTVLYTFDLDGTLAPIVSDPAAISLPDAIRKAFAELIALAPVAVITGRSRSDALLHLGIEPRYLIGNHGVEGLPGWSMRERDFIRMAWGWQQQLITLLGPESPAGIEIENKGATLSLHYRKATNAQAALAAILLATDQLIPVPRRIHGKFVENLLPAHAPDKGSALNMMMHSEGFARAFFAGDDETDEQVFRFHSKNIFSVRIGKAAESRAGFYLKGQHEMARLLELLVAMLSS